MGAIVNSRLGAFGAWSACSTSCGSGTQTRSRVCIAGNSCGAPCNGALTESRACGGPVVCIDNQAECKQWASAGFCTNKPYMLYMARFCCASCTQSSNIMDIPSAKGELKHSPEFYKNQLHETYN